MFYLRKSVRALVSALIFALCLCACGEEEPEPTPTPEPVVYTGEEIYFDNTEWTMSAAQLTDARSMKLARVAPVEEDGEHAVYTETSRCFGAEADITYELQPLGGLHAEYLALWRVSVQWDSGEDPLALLKEIKAVYGEPNDGDNQWYYGGSRLSFSSGERLLVFDGSEAFVRLRAEIIGSMDVDAYIDCFQFDFGVFGGSVGDIMELYLHSATDSGQIMDFAAGSADLVSRTEMFGIPLFAAYCFDTTSLDPDGEVLCTVEVEPAGSESIADIVAAYREGFTESFVALEYGPGVTLWRSLVNLSDLLSDGEMSLLGLEDAPLVSIYFDENEGDILFDGTVAAVYRQYKDGKTGAGTVGEAPESAGEAAGEAPEATGEAAEDATPSDDEAPSEDAAPSEDEAPSEDAAPPEDAAPSEDGEDDGGLSSERDFGVA